MRMPSLSSMLLVPSLFGLLGASACSDGSVSPSPPQRYVVEVSGETFVVEVVTAAQVDALESRLASGAEGVLSGELVAGGDGYNAPWGWHMAPESVHLPDLAIEVCDGRPSFVQDELEYWLDTVGRFCPWGARVVGRAP